MLQLTTMMMRPLSATAGSKFDEYFVQLNKAADLRRTSDENEDAYALILKGFEQLVYAEMDDTQAVENALAQFSAHVLDPKNSKHPPISELLLSMNAIFDT